MALSASGSESPRRGVTGSTPQPSNSHHQGDCIFNKGSPWTFCHWYRVRGRSKLCSVVNCNLFIPKVNCNWLPWIKWKPLETSISPTFKYFLRVPSSERIPLHSLTFSQCQLENWMQLNTKRPPRNPTIQGPQSLIHISLGWLFRSGSSRVSQDGKQDNNCLTSDAKKQLPGRGYMLWMYLADKIQHGALV